MDAKRKAALVKELVAGKGLTKPVFDPTYSRENRVWFVTAIVDAILAGTPRPPDSDVPAIAREAIGDANWAVALERESTPNLLLDDKLARIVRKDITRRVEIIYGVIAQNKALAETTAGNFRAMTPLRRFLSSRRYRGVLRMIFQVNPNENGFMRYPDKCRKPPGNWRLNIDAQPLWETVDPPLDTPLKVKGPSPAQAVAKIWEKAFFADRLLSEADQQTIICNGNLLDCSNAAACVLLDSLAEAADREMFYASIKSRGPKHFLIINPNLRSEEHCLWDDPDELKKVFTKELVEDKNFRVGDHVVIQNHGLYESVMPGGFWVAEHSLVTNCGNRNPDSGRGILYGGHGLDRPFNISVLYDDLIKTIQTRLHRTFKMADLFLRFRKNPATIPSAQVEIRLQEDVTDARTQTPITVDAFKITSVVRYDNYNAPPVRGTRPARSEGETGNPLVIFDIRELRQIAISPPTLKNTIDDQLARFSQSARMTFLKRDPEEGGGHYYDRQFWKIMFHNSMTDADELFAVFGGPGGTFRLLQRKEMPTGDGRYFRAGHPAEERGAMITRPNADTSAAYVEFLAGIGGIVRQFP